jgi:HEAT repeat protein
MDGADRPLPRRVPNPQTRNTNGPSSWCSRFGKRLRAVRKPAGPLLKRRQPDLKDILSLRSQDHDCVVEILSRQDGMRASLVPHVIALLASDTLADHALFALRKVAEERVGELTDALLDINLDYAVRRRLARVFAVCVSQRAADGLVLALDDARFDVRFQLARILAVPRATARKPPRQHA